MRTLSSVVDFARRWPNWAGLVLWLLIVYWLGVQQLFSFVVLFVLCIGFMYFIDGIVRFICRRRGT